MKKKAIIGLITFGIVAGISTSVLAHGGEEDGIFSGFLPFDEMKPYMEDMHPDFSDDELEQMYNDCHGSSNSISGQPGQRDSASDMMNRF